MIVILWLTYSKCLVYVRHCSNHFAHINSFRPHNLVSLPHKWRLLWSHFVDEKTGTEKLSNLPMVTELVSGGARIQPRDP